MTDKNLNRSRRRKNKAAPAPVKPKTRGLAGGYLTILSDADMAAIDAAAKAILWQTGVVGAPHRLTQKACDEGAVLTQEGRLQIPPALTSKALSAFAKPLTLYGRKAGQELHLGSGQVYTGTGGAAPLVLDEDGSTFREAGISDLFKAARLAEALEHIHFFSRPVVARDIETPRDMDIATAFTSLKGTSKHIMTSVSAAEDVAAIADICFTLAGSEEAFREKPFLSLNINHITPPLRLAEEAVEVMAEAIKFGLPVQCNTFGQLGASSPVPLAGSLAQTCAETLAGLVMAWLIDENAKAIFGPRPMVTDLRTGAMSGGSGEQALIMAWPVEIVPAAISREADGLAMSSRNMRLLPDEREDAAQIFAVLSSSISRLNLHETSPKAFAKQCTEALNAVPSIQVEYVSCCDAATLQQVNEFDTSRPTRVFAAVQCGKVRLIDNLPLF